MPTLTISYRAKWLSSRQIRRFQLYLTWRSDFENSVFRDTLKQVPAVCKFIPIKLNVIVDLPRLFTFDFVRLCIIHIFFEQFSTRLRIYTASGRTLYEFFRKQTRLPILKRNMSFLSYYSYNFHPTRKHWSEYSYGSTYSFHYRIISSCDREGLQQAIFTSL